MKEWADAQILKNRHRTNVQWHHVPVGKGGVKYGLPIAFSPYAKIDHVGIETVVVNDVLLGLKPAGK